MESVNRISKCYMCKHAEVCGIKKKFEKLQEDADALERAMPRMDFEVNVSCKHRLQKENVSK